jgi:HK97 gp10 family phage protein
MIGYEVEIRGLEEQLKKMQALDQIAGEELTTAMQQTVTTVASAAKENAPVGVSGELRSSINGEVTQAVGADVTGRVGTSVEYGLYVERGSRPHWPPLMPILLWVTRKLQAEKPYLTALMIQRKIAWHGTKPKPFLQPAFEASKGQVQHFFERALERIAKRMEVG